MKKNKLFSMVSVALLAAGMGMSSCADKLDLAPIDWYGSGNFWVSEAQALGNISAQMATLRGYNEQNTRYYGEYRGGTYVTVGSDGAQLHNTSIIEQNLSETNYGKSNFGGYWKAIADANLFIYMMKDATIFAKEETKNYCMGIVHGLRAYYYFTMYRNYGGVPLRLTPDVENGNYDVSTLYMPRAKASEVMAQIKADIKASLDYFGNQTTFNFNNSSSNAKYYWSKAATEMLAGEVYLWNAKVSVGDQAATSSDLTIAKTHFENVVKNYGLALQPTFAEVFSKERSNEIILAFPYSETETTNPLPVLCMYNIVTGGATMGVAYDINGNIFDNIDQVSKQCQVNNQYSNALWYQFDAEDSRRDVTFTSSWYDAETTRLKGTFVRKFLGKLSSATGYKNFDADQPVYRLALAYLSLAEIANMENKGDDVEKYINMIRKRAYGENWDEEVYGFTAGTFLENEVAILREKDKEFVQEGQRWYDVRRMTSVKNGKDTDHLVFCNEGSIVYGLEITPNMTEVAEKELVVKPVLDKQYAYRVLWPLSLGDINADPELEQTEGY